MMLTPDVAAVRVTGVAAAFHAAMLDVATAEYPLFVMAARHLRDEDENWHPHAAA